MPDNIFNNDVVTVGVGDYKIAKAPMALKTLLGSCIGVALYDNVTRVGGLLHIMLPKREPNSNQKISKYADTGLPAMINQMVNVAGAKRPALTAKLFGGARVFATSGPMFDIGKRNEEEVRRVLQETGIKIIACKTGGNKGYNITFDTSTGKITCRVFGEAPVVY